MTTKQFLSAIRDSARLSDRKIGARVGLNQSNVWRLRNGKHRNTTDEVGMKIANLYSEIFRGKQQP